MKIKLHFIISKTNKIFFLLGIVLLVFSNIEISAQTVFWASKVIGFSDDNNALATNSPYCVIGKYNVMPNFGKSASSWTIQYGIKRNQYITVAYDTTILVKQVVVCENYNPGSIAKVILINKKNQEKEIYSNNNPVPFVGGQGRFFNILVPNTDFFANVVRVEFNTSSFYDDTQIDAIGISSDTTKIEPKINISPEALFVGQPEPLKNVNSAYSELAPIITSDGNTLYFTREGHPDNYGFEKQQDVWYSLLDPFTNEFQQPINIGPPINDAYNNFAISVTPDNNSLLLGNVYRKNAPPVSGISISHRIGSVWSYPEKVEIEDLITKSRQNSYNLASDGKTLLLSIVSDTTYGEHDLYVSFLKEDGTWTKPMNLGPEINTPSNEESPFLASDGRTLYFSGNGYPGFGSNDIFMTKRIGEGWKHWSEPVNLGDKINSVYWDAYFSVPASGEYAYFVSSTEKPFSEDIYRIKLPTSLRPETVVLISGKVLNSKTNQPIEARLVYEELPSGQEIGVARSNDSTGNYKIALPAGKKYGFLATSTGFISVNQNIDLTKITQYKEVNKDLMLVPIEVGEEVKLNNIFFDFGKFDLLEDSKPELNRVVKLLQSGTIKKIRIEGHTDNIGNAKDNQILSEKRAQAVADYLISSGVKSTQINVVGYGKTKPVASNDTEEDRQKNRRVDFVILEK
jgi:outer membrane protein OmpA-like peptidoglycan-associated protein